MHWVVQAFTAAFASFLRVLFLSSYFQRELVGLFVDLLYTTWCFMRGDPGELHSTAILELGGLDVSRQQSMVCGRLVMNG